MRVLQDGGMHLMADILLNQEGQTSVPKNGCSTLPVQSVLLESGLNHYTNW